MSVGATHAKRTASSERSVAAWFQSSKLANCDRLDSMLVSPFIQCRCRIRIDLSKMHYWRRCPLLQTENSCQSPVDACGAFCMPKTRLCRSCIWNRIIKDKYVNSNNSVAQETRKTVIMLSLAYCKTVSAFRSRVESHSKSIDLNRISQRSSSAV